MTRKQITHWACAPPSGLRCAIPGTISWRHLTAGLCLHSLPAQATGGGVASIGTAQGCGADRREHTRQGGSVAGRQDKGAEAAAAGAALFMRAAHQQAGKCREGSE